MHFELDVIHILIEDSGYEEKLRTKPNPREEVCIKYSIKALKITILLIYLSLDYRLCMWTKCYEINNTSIPRNIKLTELLIQKVSMIFNN